MSHLFGYFQGYAKENLPFLPNKDNNNYRKTKRSPKDHITTAHLEATQPRSKRQACGDISLRHKNMGCLPQPLKATFLPSENSNSNTLAQDHPIPCHHCPTTTTQPPLPTSTLTLAPTPSFTSSEPNVSMNNSSSTLPLRPSNSMGCVMRGFEAKPLKEDSFSNFSDQSSMNQSLSSLLDLSDDEDESPVPDQHILPSHMMMMPNSNSQGDLSMNSSQSDLSSMRPNPTITVTTSATSTSTSTTTDVTSTSNQPTAEKTEKKSPEEAYRFHEIYCAEYATDIYDYLRRQELEYQPDPDYLHKIQPDLTVNMRQILIDWLVEVAEEYDISLETLLLAKNYIDRFLSLRPLRKGRLQLLGITALLVASKYEELSPVEVDNLVYISDNTYTKGEVLAFESDLLNTLGFNMAAVTEKNFLRRYLQAAVHSLGSGELANRVVRLSHYLIERTMQEYTFLKYSSSTLACSAICLAMHTLGQESWTPALEHYTAVTKQNRMFRMCVSEMLNLFRHSWNTRNTESELQSVNEKYGVLFTNEAFAPPASPPSFCVESVFTTKMKMAREML